MINVIWNNAALDALAEVYAELSRFEQDELAREIETFNRRLARDPFSVGESRGSRLRLAFVRSLPISFWVHPNDQTVYVRKLSRPGHRSD